MEVTGPGSVPPSIPIRQLPPTAPSKSAATGPVSPRDAVEISAVGKMLDQASQSSDVRAERLAQIKAAIEAGEYETPEKLEAALEKLLGAIESGRE